MEVALHQATSQPLQQRLKVQLTRNPFYTASLAMIVMVGSSMIGLLSAPASPARVENLGDMGVSLHSAQNSLEGSLAMMCSALCRALCKRGAERGQTSAQPLLH